MTSITRARLIFSTTAKTMGVENAMDLINSRDKESPKYNEMMQIASYVAKCWKVKDTFMSTVTGKSSATIKFHYKNACSRMGNTKFREKVKGICKSLGIQMRLYGPRKLFHFTQEEEARMERAKILASMFMEKYSRKRFAHHYDY